MKSQATQISVCHQFLSSPLRLMNLSLKRVSQTVVGAEFWVPFTVISIAIITADVPSMTCSREPEHSECRALTYRL